MGWLITSFIGIILNYFMYIIYSYTKNSNSVYIKFPNEFVICWIVLSIVPILNFVICLSFLILFILNYSKNDWDLQFHDK